MGICHTKTNSNQKKKQEDKIRNLNYLQTEFNATQESGFKRTDKVRLSYDGFQSSPYLTNYIGSRRHITSGFGRKGTGQLQNTLQNGLELVIQTNASKKYSLVKTRQTNEDFKIMQNNRTGIKVVMESISKEDPQSTEFVKWLIQSPLDHQNIIKMIEVFQDQNQYQIIYEYFDGQEIQEIMKEDIKIHKKDLAKIFEQMLQAISYLHTNQLIHGHLNLNSFRISRNNDEIQVKLFDLKAIKMKASKYQDVESIRFLPPECLYRTEHYSKARDIWAVGLICYTLRKRQLPYKITPQTDLATALQIVKQHNFTFGKSKNEVYKSFLNSILAKDPKQRKSCSDLLDHQFIVMNKQQQKKIPQIQLLNNILYAKQCCLLQELILCYFIQEFNWDEYILIQKLFFEGDQDLDGLLNKQELLNLFNTYLPDQSDIEHQIDEIFVTLELNDKGGMNNSHFQAMTASRNQILTQNNIEICFSIFSQNKSEITLRGLKRHLNYDGQDLIEEFARLTDDLKKLSFVQFEKLINLLL